jgi:aryl-alcohol dehydrogenase-like predicted oxidoreductase
MGMPLVKTEHRRLALGSAQFGLNYGVSNTKGVVPLDEISGILSLAWEQGLGVIDTAKAYGSSEEAIGLVQSTPQKQFQLITKILGLEERSVMDIEKTIRTELADSLQKLKCQSLEGLLLHREADLLGPRGDEIWKVLTKVREEGLVRKVGVSSHSPLNFLEVLQRYPLQLAQVPCSILDRRYTSEELLGLYASRSMELHARSIFLQGFFFFAPESLPPFLQFAREEALAAQQAALGLGLSAAALSLNWVLDQPWVSKVVFAVTSLNELREILAWPRIEIPKEVSEKLGSLAERSKGKLQDPLLWGIPSR